MRGRRFSPVHTGRWGSLRDRTLIAKRVNVFNPRQILMLLYIYITANGSQFSLWWPSYYIYVWISVWYMRVLCGADVRYERIEITISIVNRNIVSICQWGAGVEYILLLSALFRMRFKFCARRYTYAHVCSFWLFGQVEKFSQCSLCTIFYMYVIGIKE